MKRALAGLLLALAVGRADAADRTFWEQRGCKHGYTFEQAKRGVRAVMYGTARLTRQRGRLAWKFARCVTTRNRALRLGAAVRRGRVWRRSYTGYWSIRQRRLSSVTAGMLARLRGCETRGIAARYGPGADYRWDGHHKGAYQYTISTWARAQAWAGVPFPHRRWSAHVAAPGHQDVVTAVFFPAHRSEWACSA